MSATKERLKETKGKGGEKQERKGLKKIAKDRQQ